MENGAGDAKDPSGFLSEILGNAVTVKLNSGVVYKGVYLPKWRLVLGSDIASRRIAVRRWLHEHRARADEGVCQREVT